MVILVHTRRAGRTLAVLAALAALTVCGTWRRAGVDESGGSGPAAIGRAVAAASGPHGQPVRLTTRGGESVVLRAPRVSADSAVGTEARSGARRAVALADVSDVEAWRVSPRRTLVAVAVGALVAAAVAYAALTAWVAGNV
jgi:hypothetical protein